MERFNGFFYCLKPLEVSDREIIIQILARDGWHGFRALTVLLKKEKINTVWRDYTATTLWMIGKALVKDDWELPLYIDLIYPEKKDARTPEQIKRDIVERLTT